MVSVPDSHGGSDGTANADTAYIGEACRRMIRSQNAPSSEARLGPVLTGGVLRRDKCPGGVEIQQRFDTTHVKGVILI